MDQEITFESLATCFAEADKCKHKYIAVLKIEFGEAKFDLFPAAYFRSKFNFYHMSYNDNLHHRFIDGDRIMAFASGNKIEELKEHVELIHWLNENPLP